MSTTNPVFALVRAHSMFRGLLLLLLAVCVAQPAVGQVVATSSIASGNWNSPATWPAGEIPTALYDVTINPGHIVEVPTGYTANAKTVTISSDSLMTTRLSVAAGGTLAVTETLTVNAQEGASDGGLISGGTVTIGILHMTGSVAGPCSRLEVSGGDVHLASTPFFTGNPSAVCVSLSGGALLLLDMNLPLGATLNAAAGSTVVFTGAFPPQRIEGAYNFSNLTLAGGAEVIAADSINIANTLSLGALLRTEGFPTTVSLAGTGAIVDEGGVIVGRLARTFASLAPLAFPVGTDLSSRMLVTILPTAGTPPFVANVTAVTGAHPSSFSPSRSMQGHWLIDQIGSFVADYSFSCSGPVMDGDPSSYVIGSWNGTTWSTRGAAPFGNGTTTGVGASAGWGIGEPASFTCGPPKIFPADNDVCPGTTGHLAYAEGEPGATWSWTITGGTITAGAVTNSITYSVDPGATEVVLTATTSGTCGSLSSSTLVATPVTIWIGEPLPGTCALFTGREYMAQVLFFGGAMARPGPGPSLVSNAGGTGAWSITGGTITGNPGPNLVNFVPDGSGTVTLTFTLSGGLCAPTLVGTKSWTAVPPPTITAPHAVCPGTTGHTASVPAIDGATYTWTIGGGAITAGHGTNTITFNPTMPAGQVNLWLTIDTWVGDSLPIDANVVIGEDATITASAMICRNSSGQIASVPYKAGLTYTWSISGGTITGPANTNSITFSIGDTPDVTLWVDVSGGCGSPVSNSFWIETTPNTLIQSTATIVCPGATGLMADVPAQAGATYAWTITGGTITAGAITPTITYSVDAGAPNVILGVTVTTGTCGAGTGTRLLPTPATVFIGGVDPAGFCQLYANQLFTASVPSSVSATYSWSITGGAIVGSNTLREIQFTAGPTGSVVLTVNVTGSECGNLTGTRTLDIVSPPVITAPGSVCPGSTGHVASVPAVIGATYSWSVSGGTILAGQGTNSITFEPTIASGAIGINLDMMTPCGGQAGPSRQVYVGADATITSSTAFCRAATGLTATVPYQAGLTYAWSITGGTITSGAGTNSITFNAGVVPQVWLGVDITGGCAPTHGWLTIDTGPHTAISYSNEGLCPGSSGHQAWVAADPGTTHTWTITNGTITGGQGTNAITYSIDPAVSSVVLGVSSTSGTCGLATNTITVPLAGRIYFTDPAQTTCTLLPNTQYTTHTAWDPTASYAWTITGGTIDGSSTLSYVTFTTGASGDVVISLQVTGTSCPQSNFVTIPITPSPIVTAPASACAGAAGLTATVTPVSGATYEWTVTGGTLTGGQGTAGISFTAGAGPSVALSVQIILTCGGEVVVEAAVTVGADLTITFPSQVCINSGPHAASVPFQSGATYTWAIYDGTLVSGQGTNAITFNAGSAPWVSLEVTVTNACGTFTQSYGVVTSPPVAIQSTGIACPNSTNTALVELVPATTYTWSITGGTIVSGQNTNQLTFSVGATGPVELSLTATNSCGTSTVSPYRIEVGVPPIMSHPRACASTSHNASVPWSQGGTYLWTITGATLDPGSSLTNSWINFTAGPSGEVSLSVTISGLSCSPITATKVLPIDPPGTMLSISAPPVICANATGTATTDPYPGATFDWIVTNGTIVSGQGTNSITFTAGATFDVGLQVSTTLGCGPAWGNGFVPLNADTTITAPPTPCISSGGHMASVPPQSGATYNWILQNGTITAGQGTNSITFSVGAEPWAHLDVDVTTACGTGHGSFHMQTSPPAEIFAPWQVCASSIGNIASVTLVAGTTYAWTLTGPGTISSGQGTNAITFDAAQPGDLQIAITSTNGCGTSTATRTITVGTPVIASFDRICSTATNGVVSVPWNPDATYSWTITGGTFTSSPSTHWVDFLPGPSGAVNVSVTIGGLSCSPITASKTIPIDAPSSTLPITSPAVVCANSNGNVAATTLYDGMVYDWTIGNGAITSGQGTNSITFTAGSGGVVDLSVHAFFGCGHVNVSRSVPINADTSITAPASVCVNSGGHSASVPLQSGATYNWVVNEGTLTSGQGTNAIIFAAGSSVGMSISVTVTTACGSNTGYWHINTNPPAIIMGPQLVCANSTNTSSVRLVPGATYGWSITGGTIISGASANEVTYTVGTAPAQLTVTSTDSCGTATNTINLDVGTPVIRGPEAICPGQTNLSAWVAWAPGATYSWTITGGTITSQPNVPWVDFSPSGAGNVTLGVTVNGLS
ncbi:MAG: hypothetical protein WA208_20360, partial [Thermoanaerobaculia bacterium]